MALSATFTANFDSFFKAVEQADKAMQTFTATVNKTNKDLAAISTDAPKNLQKITTETKNVDKASTEWLGTLNKMAGAVGIAFSVNAVAGFIGSIYETASAINDMSLQWGISTKEVQQWTGAAKASGVEAETVGKSIFFLQEKLSGATKEYDALLANIGLSGDKLRSQGFEVTYRQVLEALAGIPDKALQADVALGILGPSYKKMLGAVRDGLLDAKDAQVAMTDETIKRLVAAQNQWKAFKDSVVMYSGEMLAAVQTGVGKAWTDVTKPFKDYLGAVGELPKVAAPAVAAQTTLGRTIKTTGDILKEIADDEERAKKAMQAREKAIAEAKREQDAYNKSITDLQRAWSGGDAVAKAQLYLKALSESIPLQKMTRTQQDSINKVMVDALEAYEAVGTTAPQAMYDVWFQTLKTREQSEALTGVIKGLKQEYATWKAPEIRPGGGIGEILGLTGNETLPGLVGAGGMAPPGLFDGLATGLVSNLSSSILRAIEGGGNVFAAAGSSIGNFLLDPKQSGVGKAITSAASKLPSLMGTAISAALPAVGALIGPAVEWLSKKLTSWFGKKEHDKLRDAFVSAAGGIHELDKAAAAAGKELDRLLAAKSTDAVKAAMQELEDAIKLQETAYDAAMEAAKRYGFTIEELGPAMRRQELDKQAQQLFKDWEVLNAAGIDTIAITERMSESVSTYIQQAMAMGFEVPNAMKPMLQAFADAGKLVDADGNAITDLEAAGLSFTMTMSEGFKKLIDEVHLLTDAISRGLGLAISNVPPVVVPVTYSDSGAPTGPRGAPTPMESYQQGTDGFKNFGAGTPVMLHGWEAVVPREESGAFATVSGSAPGSPAASAPAIIINAQGALFNTPADLQRLADRVSEALTAKYSVMSKLRAAV